MFYVYPGHCGVCGFPDLQCFSEVCSAACQRGAWPAAPGGSAAHASISGQSGHQPNNDTGKRDTLLLQVTAGGGGFCRCKKHSDNCMRLAVSFSFGFNGLPLTSKHFQNIKPVQSVSVGGVGGSQFKTIIPIASQPNVQQIQVPGSRFHYVRLVTATTASSTGQPSVPSTSTIPTGDIITHHSKYCVTLSV